MRTSHTTADLELPIVAAGARRVEEDLDHFLFPEVVVALRHGVPGRVVVGVEAEEEALVAPPGGEASLVGRRSPRDRLRSLP
jgi:hypothetical protein